MMDGLLQVLFFAGLALFLGFQFYRLLGKQSGRTPEEHAREERARREAATQPVPQPASAGASAASAPSPAAIGAGYGGRLGEALAAIAEADPGFDPTGFLDGAKSAYRMIVEAYAAGDREALRPLLSARVFDRYAEAISQREGRSEVQTTEVDRIAEADIEEAALNEHRARVKVRFKADLAQETRNAQGERIAGDLSRLETIEEIWTFERRAGDPDPNWVLAGVRPV